MIAPDLSIETTFDDGTCTVRVAGELDPDTAPKLDGELRDAVQASGCVRLVVDLEAVTFVDSAGLAVLLDALQAMRAREGVLVLRNPSSLVRRLLDITALTDELVVE